MKTGYLCIVQNFELDRLLYSADRYADEHPRSEVARARKNYVAAMNACGAWLEENDEWELPDYLVEIEADAQEWLKNAIARYAGKLDGKRYGSVSDTADWITSVGDSLGVRDED